jgi:hypothetical protein
MRAAPADRLPTCGTPRHGAAGALGPGPRVALAGQRRLSQLAGQRRRRKECAKLTLERAPVAWMRCAVTVAKSVERKPGIASAPSSFLVNYTADCCVLGHPGQLQRVLAAVV